MVDLVNDGVKGIRISFNATTEQTIVAPVTGGIMRIRRMRISVSGATNITVRDGVGGNIIEILQFPAAGMLLLDDGRAFDNHRAYYASAIGGTITLQSSAAVQVEGRITYDNQQ